MGLWAFLLGLIMGVFPITLILKTFKGKFLFVANPYVKGAIFGFLFWAVINVFIYFEAKHNLFGLVVTEEGFGTIVMVTSSLHGFLTSGLAAAYLSTHMGKKNPKKS